MKSTIAILSAILAATACSSSPGQPSPDRAGLAYTVPDPNPLRYEVADTSSLGIDMQGTFVDVAILSSATLEASFEPAADGVTATVTYLTLSGTFSNSMGPSVNVGSTDLPEPATLSVDRRGAITVDELPQASAGFRQILGAEGAFRRLFVRLPGIVVDPGAMWTDTVMVNEDMGQMNSSSTEVITSTLAGDTTVNGRTFLVIRSDIEADTRIAGQTEGMEITQQLHTTASAITLWDPARRAVFERVETGTAAGSMALPAMGVAGVPITMSSKSIMRLQSN